MCFPRFEGGEGEEERKEAEKTKPREEEKRLEKGIYRQTHTHTALSCR